MKSNTPTLRFPEFSGEWEAVKLDDMLSTIVDNRGKTPPVEEEGIPLIEVNAIGNASINYSSVGKYVEEHVYQSWFRKHLSTNDVLFSTVGKTGLLSIYRNERKAAIAQNIVALRAKNSINPDFLYYLLLQDKNNHKFKKIEMIAVQPSVKVSQMIHLRFAVPHFEEQQKIASFLTAVDERIAAVEKKVELLKKYKKGMMHKIFAQEIRFRPARQSPDGSSRMAGGDENGKEYPEWEEKRLGEVGKFISGQGFSDEEQGGSIGIPFYKVSDMNLPKNESEMLVANNYVNEEQIFRKKYKVIKDKSIIFAKVGAAIFLERKRLANNYLIDNNMMAFIPRLEINFMKHIFQTLRLSRFAQVGALPSYNASDLSIIKLTIPVSKREQQKIAEFLSYIDDKIALEERRLAEAKRFKKFLLQQMFV